MEKHHCLKMERVSHSKFFKSIVKSLSEPNLYFELVGLLFPALPLYFFFSARTKVNYSLFFSSSYRKTLNFPFQRSSVPLHENEILNLKLMLRKLILLKLSIYFFISLPKAKSLLKMFASEREFKPTVMEVCSDHKQVA